MMRDLTESISISLMLANTLNSEKSTLMSGCMVLSHPSSYSEN